MPFADDPPVTILASDHRQLVDLVLQATEERHPVAGFLLGELQRATVVDRDLAADTVTLNSWVAFRTDRGWQTETRLLVHPERYASATMHLSVLSPLGAALIGLRVGDSIRYRGIEGMTHVATVEAIDAPPLRSAAVHSSHRKRTHS